MKKIEKNNKEYQLKVKRLEKILKNILFLIIM